MLSRNDGALALLIFTIHAWRVTVITRDIDHARRLEARNIRIFLFRKLSFYSSSSCLIAPAASSAISVPIQAQAGSQICKVHGWYIVYVTRFGLLLTANLTGSHVPYRSQAYWVTISA
jgi:hypothetical protein